ncbi:hypothetical protein COT78_03645 [Candidatus Berkelbacteria bacterium CG10_big_fil_rev_8_21_14_0_10_43_13]|uniref:Antitoxin n=1 Tax=Candidatus Berkelbacteria bacterium CG10_big_fil_rev_8_21_14_0_10_43_13 TaxID=1974514 RepID=A0A2H0W7V4_9BACT|nr:MAG: hypothetical protein COT78_03645 [Candidatus Berkelbacteria bacterium CG10_big_fil_rev_8_21_14_0_10_43_13]
MLDVDVDKILPVTEVRDSLNKIVDDVEGSDELYVITKNGKPSAVIAGVQHLEKLTGVDHKQLMPDDKTSGSADKKPDEMGPLDSSNTASTAPDESNTTGLNPIIPLSGDLNKNDTDSSTPINPTLESDEAPTATLTPSTPTTNNGALASPIQPATPAPSTAPMPSPVTPSTTPPVPVASPSNPNPVPAAAPATTPPTAPDSAAIDDADDIFGPDEDEPEVTPSATATPANLSSTPAPTSTIPSAPPPMGTSTGPATNPPTQNPPVAPGQM